MVIRCRTFCRETRGGFLESVCQAKEWRIMTLRGLNHHEHTWLNFVMDGKTYSMHSSILKKEDNCTMKKSTKNVKVHHLMSQERIEQKVNTKAVAVSSLLNDGKRDGSGRKVEYKKQERAINGNMMDKLKYVEEVLKELLLTRSLIELWWWETWM